MRSTLIKFTAIGSALMMCGSAAFAWAPAKSRVAEFGQPGRIDYANAGGIRDWYAPNERSVYIMDRTNRWYLATLTARCPGLRYESLGFRTDGSGHFDSFGKVRTRDHSCAVATFVRAPRPAAKGGKGLD